MGTLVTIEVVPGGAEAALERAFGWFAEIEARCTRFVPESELMLLCGCVGRAVRVSPMLFEAVRFAVMVAGETGGAFDPSVGGRMEARGFNREHRSGAEICSEVAGGGSWRDIVLDAQDQTILLRKAMVLDLGAVAKGLAIDMAACELASLCNFAIDAGGDLYLGGVNRQGEPWSAGIRHPRADCRLIHSFRVSNKAVCTSGDYERPGHLLDPLAGDCAGGVASATVVADSAMLADALATAAFVLGPGEGIALLERMDVEGLLVTEDLVCHETRGFRNVG